MAQWKGKSRGTVFGYQIFIFFIKRIGISAAYVLLYFVAFYFLLFSPEGSKAAYYYYRKRLGLSIPNSVLKVYQNYFKFGQTIIDKVAISSGLRDKFTYEFDGIEKIRALLEEKKGGILISAHVGNFEIANFFFEEIDFDSKINLITTDAEHEGIKEYLDGVTAKSGLKLILIKDDMSHIFHITAALGRNELVCFTGDRYFEGNKVLSEELLGKVADFPAGPFVLSSRLNVPVLFVYVMKETSRHYHLYARKANFKRRDAQAVLKEYTTSIEWILSMYPLQWFNFFNFWKNKEKH